MRITGLIQLRKEAPVSPAWGLTICARTSLLEPKAHLSLSPGAEEPRRLSRGAGLPCLRIQSDSPGQANTRLVTAGPSDAPQSGEENAAARSSTGSGFGLLVPQ
ncbi:hypothetical protein CB1_001616031 [Camelus ferus]|nr:hypothetical protein CB1_001616031 [Camelus ferus]